MPSIVLFLTQHMTLKSMYTYNNLVSRFKLLPFLCQLYLLCPAPIGQGQHSDVCLTRISGLSRQQWGLGRIKLAQR